MRTLIAAFLFIFTGLNFAHAESSVVTKETCRIESMSLAQDTQIFCSGILEVAAGSVIDTEGHSLQIVVDGAADLGPASGLTIDTQGKSATILVYVRNHISGQLNIRNESKEDGLGGIVEITVGAMTADYQQSISNGIGGLLTVIAGGELLKVEGPQNTIARN